MTEFAYHCPRCDETFEFDLPAAPKSVACPSCGGTKTAKTKPAVGATGSYRFSETLGTVVRVSARVPGLKKGKPARESGPSCPPGGCGSCQFA